MLWVFVRFLESMPHTLNAHTLSLSLIHAGSAEAHTSGQQGQHVPAGSRRPPPRRADQTKLVNQVVRVGMFGDSDKEQRSKVWLYQETELSREDGWETTGQTTQEVSHMTLT